MQVPGVEADDVIGTMAFRAVKVRYRAPLRYNLQLYCIAVCKCAASSSTQPHPAVKKNTS